ncbi:MULTISPECIES: sugar ABC transporter permease [unclassified Rhodococcus (in: high G+C Gram-positive bacteria)]|uniref:sugar ABC transporter permease n=1 Tax=unclassified Rhodococcus (in: high G+C Gram-positive bacteria) TaxID=192944 RepID=UPI0004863493|nr:MULTISPECIES: ABC transporter permease [unclassified Rhodococcus (in: high G+C Gram-positive bacteria)]MBY6680318.1 ABC transporter permease [Rhodococcus sp. BP-316]MBY6684686.1 ABC transporter permease [Rhodococcus sp. BP-288]MBY6692830.1 ABC transporter permease [Rhodococcus sp. BP-188]MBY6698728.1 ABC transporter permease [Rhodococcus sp. BP-285]MBY6701407.1 ABC transporter permease [Rhodococcus sp. BP-283]
MTAAPEQDRARSDFSMDTDRRSFGDAGRDYVARLRGGELGALPALAGLVVLLVVFSSLSGQFLTLNNVANLLTQGAATALIGMGLVFVLLLGEIDLSAGTGSGVAAAILALHYTEGGNLLGGMGTGVFLTFCAVLVVAGVLAAITRLWAAIVPAAIALAIALLGVPANPWIEIVLAICVGASIGCLTGFLVSRVGIPSFVVTLALFLAWGGVVLQLIGEGGTLGISDNTVLFAVANRSLPVWASWVLFAVVVGGFAAINLSRQRTRLKQGLTAPPTSLLLVKIAALTVFAALATWAMTVNRSPNPAVLSIAGVPYVVPIVLFVLVLATFVLDRTSYGRHVYAVGGNAEASRRAGIDVRRIRMSVFVVSSTIAALGAIVAASKVGSVDPQAGGGNTLLFAVGAAVIGGTSLFGGRGRVRDAVIGAAVIAVIDNGLRLQGQSAAVVSIVTGLVLLLAASVDALSRRRAPTGR